MKQIEELLPYKVCAFLDKHRGEGFDSRELNRLVIPDSPYGTVESLLRKIVRSKTIYLAGTRDKRYLYASHGDACRLFEIERNQKYESLRKPKLPKPTPKVAAAYIQAALAAHPLHSWKGTH